MTLPRSCESVSIDLRWAIPKGFYGKIYPRSSFVINKITVDAGLIDSDYRGIVEILFVNHSNKAFTMPTGDRAAQIVFIEQFNVRFEKVNKRELVGVTKRGEGGFGSTGGVTVIKKTKKSIIEEQQESFDESVSKLSEFGKSGVLQIAEKSKEELQIVEEEAIMEVDNKVIVREKIIINQLFR